MDRRRPALGFILGLAFTGFAASCAPRMSLDGGVSPDVLKWIRPGTDIVQVLSEEPGECLPISDVRNPDIELGRAAFRSPFLLGGQAARQGLTCQACHMQGQTNSHFFVVGLSGEPGTADVTNFHFSDDLGDEIFNPSVIPSLSDNVQGVDYTPETSDLEVLVNRLITKEFNGEEPDARVFSALLSYLRALDVKNCDPSGDVPKLQGEALLNYNLKAISGMFAALETGDYASVPKQFMITALRHEIGKIHNRYPAEKALRAELKNLGQLLNARGGNVEEEQLTAAHKAWNDLTPKLKKQYPKSLFNPAFIRKWVAAG